MYLSPKKKENVAQGDTQKKREAEQQGVFFFAVAFFPEEISYIESLYSAMGEGKRNGGENTV